MRKYSVYAIIAGYSERICKNRGLPLANKDEAMYDAIVRLRWKCRVKWLDINSGGVKIPVVGVLPGRQAFSRSDSNHRAAPPTGWFPAEDLRRLSTQAFCLFDRWVVVAGGLTRVGRIPAEMQADSVFWPSVTTLSMCSLISQSGRGFDAAGRQTEGDFLM